MSHKVLYFLHSTSVISFYIDVVLGTLVRNNDLPPGYVKLPIQNLHLTKPGTAKSRPLATGLLFICKYKLLHYLFLVKWRTCNWIVFKKTSLVYWFNCWTLVYKVLPITNVFVLHYNLHPLCIYFLCFFLICIWIYIFWGWWGAVGMFNINATIHIWIWIRVYQ